jgi:hypothetical protein
MTLTPERRIEIEQAANLYGSANCWTGTTGTLATMVRELLDEVDLRVEQLRIIKSIFADIKGDVDELQLQASQLIAEVKSNAV